MHSKRRITIALLKHKPVSARGKLDLKGLELTLALILNGSGSDTGSGTESGDGSGSSTGLGTDRKKKEVQWKWQCWNLLRHLGTNSNQPNIASLTRTRDMGNGNEMTSIEKLEAAVKLSSESAK